MQVNVFLDEYIMYMILVIHEIVQKYEPINWLNVSIGIIPGSIDNLKRQ